ncbi:MAG: hypothetical protein L0Z70_11990 [Chloroflexi bacterium]|nr:hypothetical protein [Chloroflexota bacterium]
MAEDDDIHAALIAEQFRHALDLQQARLEALALKLEHLDQLVAHRLEALEGLAGDHEQRLRGATEGVTQFKTWAGLASGGASIVSLIALLRAFLGG